MILVPTADTDTDTNDGVALVQLNHPDVPVLPEHIPADLTNEDELLQLIHQVIFDVRLLGTVRAAPGDASTVPDSLSLLLYATTDAQTNIVEGELVCNNCARSYPVTHAVPNMLLEDDEM